MLIHPLLDKLQALRFTGMLTALQEQLNTADIDQLCFEERLGLLVDREMIERENRRLKTRLSKAKLRINACVEDVDFRHRRGLDKSMFLQLASCQWIKQKITLTNPTYSYLIQTENGISTNQPVNPYVPRFSSTAHVNGVYPETSSGRFIEVNFLQPNPLVSGVGSRNVHVPKGTAAPGVLDTCRTIVLSVYPRGNYFVAERIDTTGVNQASSKPSVPVRPEGPPLQHEKTEEPGKPQRSRFFAGFGFYFNYHFWALTDFKTSAQTVERYNAVTGWDGSAETFSGSCGYGGSLLAGYRIRENHALGLGVGYTFLPGGTYTQSFNDNAGYESTVAIDLSTHLIPVEVFYKMRLKNTPFSLDLAAGIDFYRLTAYYDWQYIDGGIEHTMRGDLTDSCVGFHLSFGGEWFFSKHAAFVLKAGYGFGKCDHLTGMLTDQDGSTQRMQLTMIDEPGYGESLWLAPDGALPSGQRPAKINFDGLRIMAGIQIFLWPPLD